MKPRRPYLLRALHEWISDSGETPHIVVDAAAEGVSVPRQYVKDGKIVLNVSFSATQMLKLGNDFVSFEARFGGVGPIPRTGRRRRPPPERTAPPNRSVRSCRWSSSAKGVLDPNDAVRAVGHPFDREHIEAHRMAAPRCLPLQEELSGTNDFALLAPGDRGKRSTEIDLSALPHLDDG